jgi:hypothetical protein
VGDALEAPHLHVIISYHNHRRNFHHFTFTNTPSKHPSIMPPLFWTLGCIYGASSVMLGAFGAHGLKKKIADPQKLANWNTAAHYQVRYMA